jgi:DNA-binding NarL/FixJ family response regulator
MSRPPISVLYVEDHTVVREAISRFIDLQPDMKVIASAPTGEEGVQLYAKYHPDVTLMDLQLPRMSGLQAIEAIRDLDAEARVVVLTMYHGDEDIYRALKAGAATYLLKDTLSDDLVRVIREVHEGRRPYSSELEVRLADRSGAPTLTPREIQVIELVSQGMRNKEIAAALGISKETADAHLKHILAKLGVNDRTAAVNIALRRGIIHLS